MASTLRYLLVLSLLLALVGCQPSDGLTEISGQVLLDNVPVEKGTIKFDPADGQGPSAEEKIIAGEFKGRVAPGKKKVQIYGYKKVGEYHVTGPDSPLMDKLEQIVPAKYNEATTLEETIAAGQKPLKYELSTK